MGRRSTIRRLPPEVRDEVDRLIRGGRTIDDVVRHLRALGEEVSRSAVGRYKQKFEDQLKRYREVQEVSGVWLEKLGEDKSGDVSRLLVELAKLVVFQSLSDMGAEEAEAAAPKEIMMLARAIRDLEGARKSTADLELRLRKELGREVDARLKAVEGEVSAGPARADAAEVLRRIRQEVYGIFQ